MVGGSSLHHVTNAYPRATSAMCIVFLSLGIDGKKRDPHGCDGQSGGGNQERAVDK